MLTVVIKGPSHEEARCQIRDALPYADLLELRCDQLTDVDALIPYCSKPFLLTGSNLPLHLNPAYIDTDDKDIPSEKLILSHHDFHKTPLNLDELYQQMRQTPAAFYKIAVMAQNSVDTLRFLTWARRQGPELIAVSMGPFGLLSRILGPFTYASVEEEGPFGQISAKTLTERYRFKETPKALYGLIGDPVSQSISDVTHNAHFSAASIKAVYVKMVVKAPELAAFLPLAQEIGFKGLSVTMPLKEAILPYLDVIDPEARAIGAVNTISFTNGQSHGYNTDGRGALDALDMDVSHKQFVILGFGGAGKAIAYEARKRGAHVTIVTRSLTKVKDYPTSSTILPFDILINATPLPLPPLSPLPSSVVMDININRPLDLPCRVVSGNEMFKQQAFGQFALWFGV